MRTVKLSKYIEYLQNEGKVKILNFNNHIVIKGNVSIVGMKADHLDFTINNKQVEIDGNLVVAFSSIKSLRGFPKIVKSMELYELLSIRSLIGCPEISSGELTVIGLNSLKSFKGVPRSVRHVTLHHDDCILDNEEEVEKLEKSGVYVQTTWFDSSEDFVKKLINRINK